MYSQQLETEVDPALAVVMGDVQEVQDVASLAEL